ncbi:MAG: hypothetical protein MUF48_18085 [Pirellulaceae bacterium]|jgi:alpha-N-arabinofuranosidase|nr:hypothetical protein [Pirellulaceae bacterium]
MCTPTLLALILVGTLQQDLPATLMNVGFESSEAHEHWSLHVYGAQPAVSLDTHLPHEGYQSLRVTASALSDTAFGQEVQLTPGRWYRLTGWIRTEELDPHGAPVCGTVQIQHPGGHGVVASGRNHVGTADWTRETLYFTPPGQGQTRIALFLVGYGKGTGTVWFDDLALEEIAADFTSLRVTRDPVCPGQISPFQCGQFIEYLCGLTLSMFAEKIFDGSFEGVPEYKFVFRRETDRLEQPWYPDGAVHRGEFALDTSAPFNGRQSQRVTMKPGDPSTLGVSQSGICVQGDQPLNLSLFLKHQGVTAPVRVALWGEGQTYAEATFQPTDAWQRFQAQLTPSGSDTHATLTISFVGPGTLWIDQVSLMPQDTVCGWRRDVADALKALKPGIIRFGGSTTEGFEWTDTIGEPTRRVPFTTYWGGLEPGNAGLEEFVQLCQWVGAEPLICIRFTGKTPQDAADQVAYFNGPADSPMGRLRAQHGHAAPYGVRYWQIGNELGDERYQQGVAAFCRAMKAVDPTIKLLAAFPSAGLLQQAAADIDYVCPHHYGCDNLSAMEADVQRLRQMLATAAPQRAIRLGITEWNTTAGSWGLDRAMLWTLDNALSCARYHHLMHRHCDLIEIANRSNLADSFCSGIIQTNNHAVFKTPTYYVQQLYAQHAGSIPLRIRHSPDLPADLPADLPDPNLDCSATLSADRQTLSLFVVNHSLGALERTLDVSELSRSDELVEVYQVLDTLDAGQRDTLNSWREPDRIRTVRQTLAVQGQRWTQRFAPLSVTCLKIRCRAQP